MQDIFCKTETEALEGTGGSAGKEPRCQRRLKLFAVVNSEDDVQLLQFVGQEGTEELFLQGTLIHSAIQKPATLCTWAILLLIVTGSSLIQ